MLLFVLFCNLCFLNTGIFKLFSVEISTLTTLRSLITVGFAYILGFFGSLLHATQVSYLYIFSMEAERNVCNVHVGCPAAAGS